jgi:hypothetical protein
MKNGQNSQTSASLTQKPLRRRYARLLPGVAIVALLAVSGIAAACGGGGGGGGGWGGHGGNPGLTSNCSALGPIDALQIPLASPSVTAASGSNITVSYQVEISGYATADAGTMIHFPSVYVKIPLNSTTKLAFYFVPTNATINAAGWSTVATKTTTLSSSSNFASGKVDSTLSTVSIALMQKGPVQNLTVEVQWGWSLTTSGLTYSLWSSPNATPKSPDLPSIFNPAPYVGLGDTTNTTAAKTGSTFEAELSGAVGKTTFGVSVEYPNGTEVVCQVQTNHQRTNCLIVDVPLTFANGTDLPSGNYIVHIHDSLGAIVHTISVTIATPTGHHHWYWTQGELSCSCQGGNGGRHGGWFWW